MSKAKAKSAKAKQSAAQLKFKNEYRAKWAGWPTVHDILPARFSEPMRALVDMLVEADYAAAAGLAEHVSNLCRMEMVRAVNDKINAHKRV